MFTVLWKTDWREPCWGQGDQFASIYMSPTNGTVAAVMGIERRLKCLDLPFLLLQKSFHSLHVFNNLVIIPLCIYMCLFKGIKILLVQLKVSKHLKNSVYKLDKLLTFETITVHSITLSGKLFKTEIWSTSLFHFNFLWQCSIPEVQQENINNPQDLTGMIICFSRVLEPNIMFFIAHLTMEKQSSFCWSMMALNLKKQKNLKYFVYKFCYSEL